MMFSLRIVNTDFYIATPVPDLDVCNSTFRETATNKVPVIRIYGATPGGQKTCLHVHGVFPYIYVPYDGTQPTEKYVKQFAISVDFAVQVALGKASSSRQHVYEISVVKGIPFYGYHEGERDFLKISLYNPFLVTRVVSLLQNGAIMNKVFQPHEAHIPYLLQFFMDHNLYGMNLLHASAAKFRNPVRFVDGEAETVKSSAETQRSKCPEAPPSFVQTPSQIWNEDTVPRDWILGSEVERVSFCELEVDVLASDILNKLEIGVNIGTNPGLAAIWEDEQQRRRDANESSQISNPSSQERGLIQETETERKFKERIKEIIDERDLLIQSQMGKLGQEALSPQELASLQDSISSFAASQQGLVADDSLNVDAMSQLLSQHVQGMLGEGSAAQSSQMVVDEDEPVVNQSIVQEIVEASQVSFSQELSSSMDKEMINILASLAEESSQPGSQAATVSQSILLDQGDALSDDEAEDVEELSEAEESIVMSQRVWDDIEHHSPESGDKQAVDEQGSHEASQRASQYNLEGMSDTWIGSFLGGDIPQLDGAADDDSSGQEDFKTSRKRLGMGRTRNVNRINTSSKAPDVSTRREIPLETPAHFETSEKDAEHGKTETSSKYSDVVQESGQSVWPQKGRAIRTYSKKVMSASKFEKSPPLDKEKAQKKDEKEVVVVDTEEVKEVNCEDTFRLVLSESSDSDGNDSVGVNLGSESSEAVASRQSRKPQVENVRKTKSSTTRKDNNSVESKLSSEGKTIVPRRDNIEPKVQEINNIKTSSALSDQGTSDGYTPEITKYFHSPGKKAEGNNKRQHGAKLLSNLSQQSTSCKTLDMYSKTQPLPSCSSQQETYSRKATLRKRKLTEVETKERKLHKGASSRRTRQRTDLVASLGGAMSNLKVSLEDVSQSSMLNSKFAEARTRLRNRRETPRQNYTRIVNQGLSSPVRKESYSPQRSPLLSRNNEKSSLSRKRTSPKKKEERLKKYGTLPVVIAESPKKSSADNIKFPDTSRASQQSQAESSALTSQISRKPALCTDVFSSETRYFGTGIASSRSRTRGCVDSSSEPSNRLTELFSSGTISVACSGGDEETSRKRTGSIPSRQMSFSPAGRSGAKPRNETGYTLSLHRKSLKRKLVMDSQKNVTPVSDLPGTGKKRKLSLKLKASSLRTEGVGETLVTPGDERLDDKEKSVCDDQDKISSPSHVSQQSSSDLHSQQARINIQYDDRLSGFVNKKDFTLSEGLLDDITCVPSSPGEPVSSDEISPKCFKSSPTATESDSLPVLTKAGVSFGKSQDSSDAYVSTESELRTPDDVSSDTNNAQLLSQEGAFPKEKDTELLANALFNMSFPSPLPCGEECYSPPCPSSPLDTKHGVPDPRDQDEVLKGKEVLTLSSSIVEESNASEVEESHRSSAISSLNHAQQTGYFSPAVCSVREEYTVLPLCPQLGETQSQYENTFTENESCLGQKISDKEITSDKESFESHKCLINRSNSSTSEGDVFINEGTMEENRNSNFDSKYKMSENKPCASKSARGDESNESSTDFMSHESVRTRTLDTKVTHLTDFAEADESSISSAEKSEFILKLSVEEENSTDAQLSVHNNLPDSEMEIFSGKDNDNQEQDFAKSLSHVLAGAAATESVGECKDQSSRAYVSQSRLHCTSVGLNEGGSLGSNGVVVIKPLKRPPTSEELLSSLKDYGLPQCKYQQPFCSNPDDIPAFPREVGGRVLRIVSKEVSNLPEFASSSSLQGIKHWRMVMSSAHECAVQTIDDAANLHKNVELKIALMGDGDVVVTPCRGPPSPEAVKAWVREKLAKKNIKGKKQGGDLALKKQEERKELSNDKNLANVRQDQVPEYRKVDVNVSKASVAELCLAMPATPVSKITSPEVTKELRSPSLATDAELLFNRKQTELVDVECEKKQDVMELSNFSNPVEVTSPDSLFSPNEGRMFTFASATETNVELCKSHDPNETLGTQPMSIECHDGPAHLTKVAVTSGESFVTVTPSILRSPKQTPLSTQQPLSPLLQTQNPVFPVPYHSTPVATRLVCGVQSPRCTPISDTTTRKKRLDTNIETSGQKHAGTKASSDQTPSLRQQLLASQYKFVTRGPQPRRSMPWSSQIEGPSPNNTCGFKIPQMNLQDAKALHEVQHLTLLSLELHVRTRRDVRPDPEFDPICALFYYIQTDTPPLPSGKNKVTGIICVDSGSANINTSGTEPPKRSFSNTESTTKLSLYTDAVASTSTSNVSMSRTSQNISALSSRTLLSRSGVTNYEVQYVTEEKDLFSALLLIIRKWDPDILIGYEVQMFSWGFLLERALTFEIDLCARLSRIKGSSSDSNMDAEKDRWGAAHTSEIKIAGRIILNVWRLMRHEVTLSSYSFENVAFHVLHERIPLFTFRTLSDWWDQRTALNRWRTVDHYVRRCHGNVRILESVDFIGRTSELARLFGILFFSVISRGSQYRVESMMLRIAKPMNYVPVSPSVEQRGAMRAPETIPLVMEPESRFYSDPVLVLDFQSLYPSMIIAYNYCFSTCLGRVSCLSEFGEFKFGATSLSIPPSVLKKLEGDIHISPNGVAFVKSSVRRGILPSMLDEILQTRIMVKASMKRWKADKSLERMLDARQLGLKLIANVTFGYTSAHFSGRMPCVEIGDSIVRKARETLERAIDLVNNTPRWGARVVYGDTDSLFVLLKGATKEQAFSIGKDIVDTVTAMNPKPVKLKFEKVYLPCVLQTKKRYVGYMYETLDQKEPVFDAKGIETVRRDSCPAVAKILEKSLRVLFETRDLSLVKKFVQRQCTKLMEGRASIQDFTFAKEYRGMKNYKPGACVPALELTRRMLREDRRSEPRVGERVPYVVVYGSPGLPLIQLVRRPHEVLQDPSLRLNASYYITKQILPPLNRVFSLIGMDVFTWYAELPRVVRVATLHTDPGDRKKGTISQYFSTMTCPVCQELTPTDLCTNCRARPQLSVVTLMNRMRSWERTHQHLAEICYSCCGSRDSKLCCVSLGCPVFYKLVQCTRDLKSSQHLRTILEIF